MSRTPRILAPFQIRSYRFQWPADLATSCAFEMENLALGWFILVETQSVLLLTVFASLQYLGTLVAPVFGLVGDRIGHRRLLCLMRCSYLGFAALLGGLAFADALGPWQVFAVSAVAGIVRPSDVGLRNVLISETMPADRLLGAVGLSRMTADTARAAGALAGAGTVAALGMGGAYVVVVALYALSLPLTLATSGGAPRARPAVRVSPWGDLRAAIGQVWATPPQLAALSLAFLVNISAYPFILGLLPYLARDVYGTDQAGLGLMVAAASAGCVAASLLLSRLEAHVLPGRVMILCAASWQAMILLLGQTQTLATGAVVLVLVGLAQGLCIVPMAVIQLRNAPPELRGRITGLRTLAVYGLPIGLWIAGPSIAHVGFAATATAYGGLGLATTLLMLLAWRRHLWPASAPANRRR